MGLEIESLRYAHGPGHTDVCYGSNNRYNAIEVKQNNCFKQVCIVLHIQNQVYRLLENVNKC